MKGLEGEAAEDMGTVGDRTGTGMESGIGLCWWGGDLEQVGKWWVWSLDVIGDSKGIDGVKGIREISF